MMNVMALPLSALPFSRPKREATDKTGHLPPERQTLALLLREHADAIYSVCHAVAGPADARDACQESFERIVTNFAKFDAARAPFRAWAQSVARNVCRDRLRRRKLERNAFAEHDGVVPEPTNFTDAEHDAQVQLDAARVTAALETLPPNIRSAMLLFHTCDSTYEEIAETLEVPIGTVMTWLYRAGSACGSN